MQRITYFYFEICTGLETVLWPHLARGTDAYAGNLAQLTNYLFQLRIFSSSEYLF